MAIPSFLNLSTGLQSVLSNTTLTNKLDDRVADDDYLVIDTNGDIVVGGNAATFNLTTQVDAVDEGATARFTLTTTGVADGTSIDYRIGNQADGITAADVVDADVDGDGNALTGSVTINNNRAVIAIELAEDQTTEAEETLTLSLLGDAQGTSATITINDTSTEAAGKTVTIDGSGVDDSGGDSSEDASTSDITFDFAEGTYSYSISGFDSGDVLNLPDTPAPTVNNTDYQDGIVELQWASSGQIVTIQLTGLVTQDSSLNFLSDFDTVFGTGTII